MDENGEGDAPGGSADGSPADGSRGDGDAGETGASAEGTPAEAEGGSAEAEVAAGGAPAFDAAGAAADALREHWDDLIADASATAEELRADGWEVLELHPGDVTAVSGSRWGYDVLVPDDEFETLRSWVETGSFEDHDVYRAERALVFVLVALKDNDRKRAVCCPLYYGYEAVDGLRALAADEGRVHTHVRRLGGEYVHVSHDDPDLFFPEG